MSEKVTWTKEYDGSKKLNGYSHGPFFILKLAHGFALFINAHYLTTTEVLKDAKLIAEHLDSRRARVEEIREETVTRLSEAVGTLTVGVTRADLEATP